MVALQQWYKTNEQFTKKDTNAIRVSTFVQRNTYRYIHMKHLLILLLLLSPSTYALDIDLTLPVDETPIEYNEDWEHPDKRFLQIAQPKNPATALQRKIFWTLAAADVWTTHRGLKNSGVYERNPLVGKDPSLGKLILAKFVLGNFMLNNYESWEVNVLNIGHVYAIHNNYHIIYK